MAELDDAYGASREAADAAAEANRAARRASEEVARLRAARSREARALDPRDPDTTGRLSELDAGIGEAEGRLGKAREEAASMRAAGRAARREFGFLADPRERISTLDDGIPVLLMPLRIETRFANGELWVRVFPDEWAVDAFSERLSDVEVENAARYWARYWAAGGAEDGRRASWRGLVGSHGSGRAAWIVGRHQPQNPDDEPVRSEADEVILVVAAEDPLPAALRPAASTYWEAMWRARDERAALEAARAALEAPLTADEIAAVDARAPVNLDARPAPGRTHADSPVSVAFLDLPAAADIDTSPASWSEPAAARVLPDRLVLLGYDDGELVLEEIGNPIPEALQVGPDPGAEPDEQIQIVDGDLVVPEELRWLVDFDRAVDGGMGFRIDLGDRTAEGFDRLFVLGLQLGGTPADRQARLESLLRRHRFGRNGLALVAQGTPTNNTEEAGSGFDRGDDADASFDLLFGNGPTLAPQPDWDLRRDGHWFAGCLGIDLSVLDGVAGAAGTDQRESRAMNTALWPATWGYFLDSMLHPGAGDALVEEARRFFTDYVSGRGLVPAIRVGRQPYGILPTTAFSRLEWPRRGVEGPLTHLPPEDGRGFEAALDALLRLVAEDWEPLARGVPHVAAAGDAHQLLLDIVALHPASVEFHQRYAESIEDLFNRLNLGGFGSALLAALAALGYRQRGRALLDRLGYEGDDPEIIEKVFLRGQQRLRGPVVDDRRLSESDPVRDYTADGRNYLEWLVAAGRTSLETLRREEGFLDGQPPTALLYLMLRHALLLSWWDTGLRLKVEAGSLDQPQLLAARREAPFIHVSERAEASESRWQALYAVDAAVTGDDDVELVDFIPTALGVRPAGAGLARLVDAVERLSAVPTARLERVFAEHLDCCAYRIDAWRLGLVRHRLLSMREPGGDGEVVTGIHLGAYGWLEDVRPEGRELSAVDALEGELAKTFADPADPPLRRDSSNGGFVHAPSVNHAATAAILRSGYLANATAKAPGALAVNLTSERVRLAVGLLEGIRNGQSLSALLGYRFERGLHDRHGLAEVDSFVFALREAFPLRPDLPVEASNVVDGLGLVTHVRRTGQQSYPFGRAGLPPAGPAQAAAIDAEVERLLDVHDAVADLALAEGVHQAVLGNADRVASTLDAYSRIGFPPEPAVIETPRSGVTLTHRVGLHLRPGLDPATSPLSGLAMTPRAQAEPAVNELLAELLPLPSDVGVRVTWVDPATSALAELVVSQDDLGLQPVDLVHVLRPQDEAAVGELDELILRRVDRMVGLRPDVRPEIRYLERPAGMTAFLDLAPLVEHLHSVLGRSRALRPSDLAPHNEVPPGADDTLGAPRDRADAVQAALQALAGRFTTFEAALDPLLDDRAANRAALRAGVDGFLDDLVDALHDAGRFGVSGTGWGQLLDRRSQIFTAILDAVAAVVARFEPALEQADDLLARDAALPSTATDEERFAILALAERLLSAQLTTPQPATPDLYRTAVEQRRTDFVAKLDELTDVAPNAATLSGVLATVAALLPLTPFTSEDLDLAPYEERTFDLEAELLARAVSVHAELDRRDAAATTELAAHDASASPQARVDAVVAATRALCGEDVVVVPAFTFGAAQGDAVDAAMSWSRSGQLTADLTTRPYAVEDWLHGIARVREKIRHFEQVSLLGGVVGRLELDLIPVQLPHAGEPWLALEFPADVKPTGDRLLYTGHYPGPFSKTAPQCGLLLDEWTEVLPGTSETTGVAFHYDRPSSEPPQVMLLAVPPTARGGWAWDDLVATLHETLDLAKVRAIEPTAVDGTAYAQLLPATVMAATLRQVSIATDLALNNRVLEFLVVADE